MVFSSTLFLFLFLPLTLMIYYNPFVRSRKFRNRCLLVASLFFYAWGEPFFVWLMVLSIAVGWACGRAMERAASRRQEKRILTAGVVFHVGLLFVFKYLTFVASQLGLLLHEDFSAIHIALPIGISFFTFQLLSYLFDIYYGRSKAQQSVLSHQFLFRVCGSRFAFPAHRSLSAEEGGVPARGAGSRDRYFRALARADRELLVQSVHLFQFLRNR